MKLNHNEKYFINLCKLVSEYDNPELSLGDKESATTISKESTAKWLEAEDIQKG